MTARFETGEVATLPAGTAPADAAPALPDAPVDSVLEARGLVKIYGSGEAQVRAVQGVDLAVAGGAVLLIMGPSGSGKTTLLSMLGGLLRPTEGSVRIGSVTITDLSERELPAVRRRLVGFVFQSFNLLEALSARENVEVAANLAGVKGDEARRKAERLLAMLEMERRLNAKPRALSGGEKQRVSIARALINDPAVILADEPTANLDARHGLAVVNLLRSIAKDQGKTVIIVSHDERILEAADRVVWLEDGRLREAPH